MTEIERMAREAGCFTPGASRNYWAVTDQALARFAELVRADERERIRDKHDLDAMCEAFHRVIEAHADKHSPFHQPINADAMMALRIFRGIAAAIRGN